MRLWVIALIFFPICGLSQITHRDLLQKKYPGLKKILISHSDFHPFPQTPIEWKKLVPDSISVWLVSNGEKALKEDFPNIPAIIALDFSRNGNRTRYENISFGKKNRLWSLVLAESVEGKGRFVDAIVNGIWSICEESFWGSSAHLFLQKPGKGLPDVEEPVVDLFVSETAANLALADYFIGKKLDGVSPLIRKRIYYEVNRRVFFSMQTAKYNWMGAGDKNAKLNNWAPWIMSNYLTAVLFLEKDPVKRIAYTTKTIQLTDQYINGIPEDGGCEEGPHYWTFGAGCVLDVLNQLHVATNGAVDIYNEKIIQNMGLYVYRTHIAENYFVNVADSHPEEFLESIMIWRYGKAVNSSDLSSFGAWMFRQTGYTNSKQEGYHRARALFDLFALKEIISDKNQFRENPGAWLPDVQLMTERLNNGLFIAAHGGNNGESHNHNDVGDFIIYADSDPVIIDVGSGTYTARTFSPDRYKLWFNASPYHNLPTINGNEQLEGSNYKATNVSYKNSQGETQLSMNIDKAYGPDAGLGSWKRTFSINEKNILITDSFKSKGVVLLTQGFMTVCDVNISQPGKIIFTTTSGKKLSLGYSKDWEVSKGIIPLVTEEDQGLKNTWRNQPITRIVLALKTPKDSGSFIYRFEIDK